MSLFERTSRVVRANLSSAHHSGTSSYYGLQSTDDARTSLMQICQSVSKILAIQWNTQQKIDKVQLNVTAHKQNAQAALDRGDESSARQALMTKREQFMSLVSLEAKLKEQTSLLKLLQFRLAALEAKFPMEAQQVEREFKNQFLDDADTESETLGHQLSRGSSYTGTVIDADLDNLRLELENLSKF
ncbi:MAG: PspA/IM30 family protein [Phormidesmis sp.]